MAKKPNDFDEWEAEEAERRKENYKRTRPASRAKGEIEQKKHEAGIGVYTPEEIAAHEAEAEDEESKE